MTIAVRCRPLIIGADNIGRAIMFTGFGAHPEAYCKFLRQTYAVCRVSVSAVTWR